MTKILAVFGATGVQGGSVIKHVLNDPELSQSYEIRAVETRNVNSEKAIQLEKKANIVEGNMLDPFSKHLSLTLSKEMCLIQPLSKQL